MPLHPEPEEPAAALRRRAEARAGLPAVDTAPGGLPLPTAQLVHELQVHQIELEMQNDQLRRTQAELAAARARYFDLYDLAPVGYCTLDAQGLIRQANLTAATLLGAPRGQLVGQALTRFIPDDEQDVFYRHRRQVGQAGADPLCELRMRHSDGSPFWAQLTTTAGHEDDGTPVLRTVLIDVSPRHVADEALRESELFTRSVFDSLDAHIAVLDGQGRIEAVNAAWREFGLRNGASEAVANGLGVDYLDICRRAAAGADGGGVAAATLAGIEAVLAGRQQSFELEYACHAPKDMHWFVVSVSHMQGRRAGAVVSHKDITERRLRDEQLHKLSLAVEQSPESILITDVNACIEYVNEAFVRNTGYSRREAIGQTPRLLSSGRSPPGRVAAMWAAVSQGQVWKGELHNRRKDGTEYVDSVIVTPLRQEDGTITHYVSLQEDISERTRLNEELGRHRHHLEELVSRRTLELAVARRQADAANEAKSSFLANMSHEIRTPMNAILGLNHLLRREGVTPAQALRLDKIDAASHHLLAIINDILDLSKIEAGRVRLECSNFHLPSIVDNVCSLIGAELQGKGLDLRVELDAAPAWLMGDPTRVRQALLNLASNAVKFTDRGCVTLSAHVLDDGPAGTLLRFAVHDTGIGIAADQLPRLFQSFVQADPTSTRRYSGTGLGLAITSRLAQLMGGEVGVESTPGAGSTFWFTARLQRGQAGTRPAPAPGCVDSEARLRRDHTGARILLVEDNAINQEVAVGLLMAVGLQVEAVDDGAQALARARAGPYALVLMDMQMPVLGGLDATRAIRQLPGWAHTPIVALTANAFEGDRLACVDAGMNDFVGKPMDPELLYATILRWLSASRGRQPRTEGRAAPAGVPPDAGPRPHDAEDTQRTLQWLLTLKGFDCARGLLAMCGDTRAYLQLLARFMQATGPNLAALRAALARGDAAGAAFLAHNIKGAAAAVGADGLACLAAGVETTLRTQPGPADCDAVFELALARMEQALRALGEALPQG